MLTCRFRQNSVRVFVSGFLGVLVLFALATGAWAATSHVSGTIPSAIIPDGDTWIVDSGDSLRLNLTSKVNPNSTLEVYGYTRIQNLMENQGTVIVYAGDGTTTGLLYIPGTLWIRGSGNTNIGHLINYGTVRLINIINVYGTFDNYGVLDTVLEVSQVRLWSGGVLHMHAGSSIDGGTLVCANNTTLYLDLSSTISNMYEVRLSSGANYILSTSSTGSGTYTITASRVFAWSAGDINIAGWTKVLNNSILHQSSMTVTTDVANVAITYDIKPLAVLGGNGAAMDVPRTTAGSTSVARTAFDTIYSSNDEDQIRRGVQSLAGEGVVNASAVPVQQVGAFRGIVGQQVGRFTGTVSGHGFTDGGGLWSSLGNNDLSGLYSDGGVEATLAQMAIMKGSRLDGPSKGISLWGQGRQIDQGGHDNISGYHGDYATAVLGYDAPVTDILRLGLAVGYSAGQISGADVDTDLDTGLVSVYGSMDLGYVLLDADLTYAYTSGDVNGDYTWPIADHTSGNFTANTYSGSLKASKVFIVTDDGLRIIPSIAVEAALSERDSFTESGSLLNKHFGSSTMTTVDVPVGAALSQDFDLDNGGRFTPLAGVYYVRRLEDTQAASDVTLAGANTTNIKGASTGEDLLRSELGVTYSTPGNLAFTLDYMNQLGEDYTDNALSLMLRYKF